MFGENILHDHNSWSWSLFTMIISCKVSCGAPGFTNVLENKNLHGIPVIVLEIITPFLNHETF